MPYCGHVRAGGVGSLRSTDEAAKQRGEPSAEAVEGRRRPKENFALSSTGPTQSGEPVSQGVERSAPILRRKTTRYLRRNPNAKSGPYPNFIARVINSIAKGSSTLACLIGDASNAANPR